MYVLFLYTVYKLYLYSTNSVAIAKETNPSEIESLFTDVNHTTKRVSEMSEQFGTTPLPLPLGSDASTPALQVTYDPLRSVGGGTSSSASSSSSASQSPLPAIQIQQPVQQELASFVAEPADYAIHGAAIIAVNSHFIVYAVKNGLIRILSRHSTTKTLLRLHHNEVVSDIQFFHNGEFLATVSATSTTCSIDDTGNGSGTGAGTGTGTGAKPSMSRVIVWRIYHRTAGDGGGVAAADVIATDPMLEIQSATKRMVRVIWHPYNPNQFFVLHTVHTFATSAMMATLIETTKIATSTANNTDSTGSTSTHAMADFTTTSSLQPNGSTNTTILCSSTNYCYIDALENEKDNSLQDVVWSGIDVHCVLAGYQNGDLLFFNLQAPLTEQTVSMFWNHYSPSTNNINNSNSILCRIQQGSPVTRCLFLPHHDAVLTNKHNGTDALASGNTLSSSTTTTTTTHTYTTCFVTGNETTNATFHLWSAFTSDSKPTIVQTIHIASPMTEPLRSYVLHTCYGPTVPSSSSTKTPPSCFVLACCREYGSLYAFHVKAQWSKQEMEDDNHDGAQPTKVLLLGTDYVVPFRTKYPILSCTITYVPTHNSEEVDNEAAAAAAGDGHYGPIRSDVNFDMKLFVYQTTMAQCLQLTSQMCQPPKNTYTDATLGVTVTRALNSTSIVNNNTSSDPRINDDGFEEYEIDEMEDDDEYDSAPDPSTIPLPKSAVGLTSMDNNNANPFANWLGAFTTTTPTTLKAPPATSNVSNPMATSKLLPTMKLTESVLPETPSKYGNSSTVDQSTKRNDSQPSTNTSLLSPMEILGLVPTGSKVAASNSNSIIPASRQKEKITTHASRGADITPPPTITRAQGQLCAHPIKAFVNPTVIPNGDDIIDAGKDDKFQKNIRTIVNEEIKAAMGPCIRGELSTLLQGMTDLMKPIQSSVGEMKTLQSQRKTDAAAENEQLASLVAGKLDDHMTAMFAECMRTVLIPTIESVTSQIFAKVSERLDIVKSDENSKLESISRQLSTTFAQIENLTNEVSILRDTLSKNASLTAPIGTPTIVTTSNQTNTDPYDQIRTEIVQLIQERKYEIAFRRAVSNKTVDMALFCCRSANIQDIFGDSQPEISQPILLCLMQQLGTILDTFTDTQFVVDWLQEITISLYPPVDPQIKPHLPVVVQNLVTNLMKRMERSDNDPTLRRSLQKLQSLLRGMQLK
jgi:hypothetical protein